MTLVVIVMSVAQRPGFSIRQAAALWDGAWYIRLARFGYPTSVPPGLGNPAQTTIAFFPAYPACVGAVSQVTGLDLTMSGMVVSLLAGGAAALLLWQLTRALVDEGTALRAVALFSFFPAAFVFSLDYAEGLFLAFAIACLLCLHRRWWLAAGLCGAVATASRPTAAVLVLCAAWVALPVAWRTRSPRPLLAPLLAAGGIGGYFAYLEVHTGSFRNWLVTEQRGWAQRTDFGRTTFHRLVQAAAHPPGDFNMLASVCTVAVVAVAVVVLLRWRPPGMLVIYSLGTLIPAYTNVIFISAARYALAAFPLGMAVARVAKGQAFTILLACSATLMAGLLLLATRGVYVP